MIYGIDPNSSRGLSTITKKEVLLEPTREPTKESKYKPK